MGLQKADLALTGLSIIGNAQFNPPDEKLAEGIHLRWGFERELGFPWYGFYLYRRPHLPGKPICLSNFFGKLGQTSNLGKRLRTPYGTVSSDQSLTMLDEFPRPGIPEFDLSNRGYLRFDFSHDLPIRKLEARIGFRGDQDTSPPSTVCASFTGYPLSFGPNPRFEQEIKFEERDRQGNPVAFTRVLTWETDPDLVRPEVMGLRFGKELEITLPNVASSVALTIMHINAPAIIEAFNEDGTSAGKLGMASPLNDGPETFKLNGRAINRVVLTAIAPFFAPADGTYLQSICYEPISGSRIDIPLTLFAGKLAVARATAQGYPGQVLSTTFECDLATAIEIGAGPAALVDLCFVPVSQDIRNGWQHLLDFPYPLTLPVGHPNYPASLGVELTLDEAREQARQRVKYGLPGQWPGQEFDEIYQVCLNLVMDGPGGQPMAARTDIVDGIPDSSVPGEESPKMPEQSPLDLLLLAALHPPLAQMIGLYWVDQTADSNLAYDYMLVADYEGAGGANSNTILSIIYSGDFNWLKSYVVFNKRLRPSSPLSAPENLRVYAMPGLTILDREGMLKDATNNAGLRWDLHVNELGQLEPDRPILYHVWRADLGNQVAPQPAGPYTLISKDETGPVPALVTEPDLDPGEQPRRRPDWPPFQLHFIDRGLADGWYSYEISGVDIFGRHSPKSAPAIWYQWIPAPDPRPWYYTEPPADRIMHPSAVRLLDKTPPPPPTAIEAYALDPADPTVLQDTAYNAWRASLNPADRDHLIGLRVRWLWTKEHMRQAPDVREFRVYYHPGQMNTVAGSTTQVVSTDTESLVSTTIANAHPADAYVGAWLRIGADSFKIVGSDAGSPLKLRVKHIGPQKNILPRVNAPCLITIPPFYSDGKIKVIKDSNVATGMNTQWNATMIGSRLRLDGDVAEYRIATVNSTTSLTLNRDYDGALNARPAHTFLPPASVKTGYVIRHPLFIDYSEPTNWRHRYQVVGFDEPHIEIKDEAFMYEVFLPAPDTNDGQPFAPSLADPVVFASIGISTADDKVHTSDHPRWASEPLGGRFGNEGKVGAPARIFRVRRGRLDPPVTVSSGDSDKVFATPADYNGHSFYTYRWPPSDNLKTHIFRAMDDAVFNADWNERPLRANPTLDASQKQFFPDEAIEHNWIQAKRQQIADELNRLNSFSRDKAGKAQALAYYRGLSSDALRVLAGLEGNERAFTQITILPLDPQEPDPGDLSLLRWRNRRTPNDLDDFRLGDPGNPLASESLRIYIDTLDGRATNRYFYRCAYTDGAHNPGALSLSSLPVYLPNVVPPRAPVITKVIGGDRQITIQWASNREPDVVEYRIYRVDSEELARDPQLIPVHSETVSERDPAIRPAELTWDDQDVISGRPYWYHIVAVDVAGNRSRPTEQVQGQAYRADLPPPPAWVSAGWNADQSAIHLEWSSIESGVQFLIQRRESVSARWATVSEWLGSSAIVFDDASASTIRKNYYRIKVRDENGNVGIDFIPILVLPSGS